MYKILMSLAGGVALIAAITYAHSKKAMKRTGEYGESRRANKSNYLKVAFSKAEEPRLANIISREARLYTLLHAGEQNL